MILGKTKCSLSDTLRVRTRTNDNMAFVARSKGSATGRALVVIGGILLISQVVILLTINIEAYQSLPLLNPRVYRRRSYLVLRLF